jgi:hypothetical protein
VQGGKRSEKVIKRPSASGCVVGTWLLLLLLRRRRARVEAQVSAQAPISTAAAAIRQVCHD